MASQVSNWLYEKKDYAIKALTHWVGTIYTGETAAEVLQKLSKESSVRVYNSTLYNDDGDFELIVRPYSRTLGGDLGSKTGCMTFNISSNHQASINGLYGAIDLDNVIYQVFKACGVIVEEDKLNHYRLAVRDRMGIGALNYYTGVVIKVSNGLLIGYVSKKVVQNIINGMAEEGMFTENERYIYDISQFEVNQTYSIEEPHVPTYNEIYNLLSYVAEEERRYRIETTAPTYPIYYSAVRCGKLSELATIIKEKVDTYVVQTGVCNYLGIQCLLNVINYTDPNTHETYPVSTYGFTFEFNHIGTTLRISSKGDTYVYAASTQHGASGYGWSSNTNEITGPNYAIGSSGFLIGIIRQSSHVYVSSLNSVVVQEGPEGITYEPGATIPTEEDHYIGTVYPNWITTINQTVSPGLNISNRSLIALSFTGDTQYNTQAGVIATNEMLHRLGIYVEATEEYMPANPEEGDDGEPVVIIPDAKPIPSDTPNEDYPDSVTPASKYLVSVWNMTDTMVQNFASALWSNTLWNAIKDFFTKPTDGVIALFTLYGVDVGTGASSQEIKIGGHGTGVSAIPVTTRYKTVDLGTVNVPEFYSNVEDYAPYSSAEIFLPFIGFSTVDVNEIMNSTVNIKYVFDMWTGSLVARIFVTRDGIRQELYNFTGSASVQIPLTDRDYTSAISSLMLVLLIPQRML